MIPAVLIALVQAVPKDGMELALREAGDATGQQSIAIL